jgi:hypothetical protein
MQKIAESQVGELIYDSIFHSQKEFIFYVREIFKKINFRQKNMLDIGGGSGIFSFYSAIMGVKKGIVLEPGAGGSQTNILDKFYRLQNNLKLKDRVMIENKTFQDFNRTLNKFDIILLHNSINHLDENACSSLHSNPESKKLYRNIFKKIYTLANNGANIIITDCSRYNFFAFLKIKNPFAPTIHWETHQSPELWKNFLSEAGFINIKIRWLSFRQLRQFGKFLLANKLISFFLNSHFLITAQKN